MRASAFYRYGPPEVLEMVELPDLTAQPGQVRVRVEAASVNPADTLFRNGGVAAHLAAVEPPYVAGLEFAGTIDAAGLEAGWEPGAAVMGMTAFIPHGRGAHAEQVVVDARSVVDIPKGISVVAISQPDDEDLVRGLGADQFVARGEDFAASVRELTGGGVDAVVDAAVTGRALLPAVRDCGRIMCLRAFVGELERGISTELISVRAYATESEKLRFLAGLVEQGALTPRVAEAFAPDRAGDAHARLEASGIRGRLVLAF
jgi:NADPH:quinone reductase-like Zn-dependent oxidoreductase